MLTSFINLYLKLFMILTPFFVASVFVSMTQAFNTQQRRSIALKTTLCIVVACFVFYEFGHYIFLLFGITIDAFRIGAGAILFLSAVAMVRSPGTRVDEAADENIAVVPLAIPVTVGPGTIGALLVMGTETGGGAEKLLAMGALLAATLSVGAVLYLAGWLERVLGRQGLVVLTKLTGLFVAAIAAQIVFTGVGNFLGVLPEAAG